MSDGPYTRLLDIMERLRSPSGCPWDREQTNESLKPFLLEEAYEVLEAIEKDDPAGLREELGDLLLQIVFHALIKKEQGQFSMNDVIETLCAKLIHRHPHVFGDASVENSAQVIDNWEKIKRTEKKRDTSSLLTGIPKHFPALLKAQRVQEKVSRVGFDWPDWSGAFQKIQEELAEVRQSIDTNDTARIAEELGDLLFSCVNLARMLKCDAEIILGQAVAKFSTRFQQLEQYYAQRHIDLKGLSLEELDRQWEQIKAAEKRENA